jgi:hypothetical protein
MLRTAEVVPHTHPKRLPAVRSFFSLFLLNKYITAMKVFAMVLTALIITGSSQSLAAQQWIKIAEKTVNFKAEQDVVTPQGQERKVDKIRIKCLQGTVKLKKITVEMTDGTKESYDAKGVGVLTKGMNSLAWDLPGKGNEKKLKKIELEYDSAGNMVISKKAKVEIQGRVLEE